MSAHTPGPWRIEDRCDETVFVWAGEELVAEMFQQDDLDFEVEANAHLVAAAPDLLAALESLLLCDDQNYECAILGARAAILKARGQ